MEKLEVSFEAGNCLVETRELVQRGIDPARKSTSGLRRRVSVYWQVEMMWREFAL